MAISASESSFELIGDAVISVLGGVAMFAMMWLRVVVGRKLTRAERSRVLRAGILGGIVSCALLVGTFEVRDTIAGDDWPSWRTQPSLYFVVAGASITFAGFIAAAASFRIRPAELDEQPPTGKEEEAGGKPADDE